MKKTIAFVLALVVLCVALLSTQVMAAGLDAGNFSAVGNASATQVNSGVKINGDWGAKVVFSQPVKLDGFSITLGEFAIDGNFGSLAFVLSPAQGGVDLGSVGDGFMIKIWNFGSTYMDAADTSIAGWNDLQIANGGTLKDAWLAGIVLDRSITIDINKTTADKYAVTNNINPTNGDFLVDASVIEKAMNDKGEVYLTFYAWNTTTVANSMVVQNIKGVAAPTTTATKAPTKAPTTATKAPTQAPTQTPTQAPTESETTTAAPTDAPTDAPIEGGDTTTTAAPVVDNDTTTTTAAPVAGDVNTDDGDNNADSGNPWLIPVIVVAAALLAFCAVGGVIVYKRTRK